MTIIVEDGAGLANSESYASVSFADAYFASRANDVWDALDTPAKEAALISATDFIEATYSQSWRGSKATATQALSWPRLDVYLDGFALPAEAIPYRLIQATAELAVRASAAPLVEDQGQRVVKEKVDVLETTYAEFSDPAQRYPLVTRILAPLTIGATDGGSFQSVRLVRV